MLSHFNQIGALVRAISASEVPKMELSVRGNVVWGGSLREIDPNVMASILGTVEWLEKCKWIALHYKINPALPDLTTLSDKQWGFIDELYALLKDKEYSIPEPGKILSFEASNPIPPDQISSENDGFLRLTNDEQSVDFFTTKVPLGSTETHYSNLKLVSQTPMQENRIKFVFETTEKTTRRTFVV